MAFATGSLRSALSSATVTEGESAGAEGDGVKPPADAVGDVDGVAEEVFPQADNIPVTRQRTSSRQRFFLDFINTRFLKILHE